MFKVKLSLFQESEYLMINRVEIRNFKCFENENVTGLRRFNILVGDSGSGKTAFLESLFLLASGNPEVFFRLRRWRGFQERNLELQGTKNAYEGLFRTLFHNADKRSGASIQSVDSNFGRRSLDIYYKGQETFNLDLKRPESSVQINPLVFKWDVNDIVTNIELGIKEGTFSAVGSAQVFPMHLLSPQNLSSKFNAQLYSELSRKLQSDQIEVVVKQIFKSIKSLSLELIGGEPLIHAEVDGFDEKLPLNDLSGGINKYVSIALAITANPNGVVLVDEIEDGLYFRNHGVVVDSLAKLCEKYSVQLFASTHSWEFLKSVATAMAGRDKDLSVLRTRYHDKKCTIQVVKGLSSISAINQDIEIRA